MFKIPQNEGGAATRPPRFQLLEATKLSRLPSLAVRKTPAFQLPNISTEPEIKEGFCECGKSIISDNAFLMKLRVCKSCLAVHTRVEQAIDRASIEKHKTAKLAQWSKKIGGAE